MHAEATEATEVITKMTPTDVTIAATIYEVDMLEVTAD